MIQWKYFIGQERVKGILSHAVESDSLGHAYLFCGETGVGTFAVALEMALVLHCRNEKMKPCYSCSACKKILSLNHPDFHIIMPVALQKNYRTNDGKINEAGWDEINEQVKMRLHDPYFLSEPSVLPTIPVDWIRETMHAIRRGAVEEGKNVIIIDGINFMQKESANAMLKTLEEPPPETVMFLCSEHLHNVLPTIISRCQIIRLSMLEPEVIRKECSRRVSIPESHEHLDEVTHYGSITKALHYLTAIDTVPTIMMHDILHAVSDSDAFRAFQLIDSLSSKIDYSEFERIFVQIMHSIRNAFLQTIDEAENYIMGKSTLSAFFSNVTSPQTAEKMLHICEDALYQIRVRANPSLVMTQFVISLMEYLDEQKQ